MLVCPPSAAPAGASEASPPPMEIMPLREEGRSAVIEMISGEERRGLSKCFQI
jgi:hypothetical protein